MATTVSCKGCGAELSDDRKVCPHCRTQIVKAADAALVQAADEREVRYIQQIVKLDQQLQNAHENNARLLKENSDLRAANAELLKQVTPATPTVVEKTGPGVVADESAAKIAETEQAVAASETPTKDMKTL